jgi:hypothetical protein
MGLLKPNFPTKDRRIEFEVSGFFFTFRPMLVFKFPCPKCGSEVECDAFFAGTEINCSACAERISVPRAPTPPQPRSERSVQIKISTLKRAAIAGVCVLLAAGLAVLVTAKLNRVTILKGSTRLVTSQSYRPPVEITVVAKTDSTNLRMGYAADQIIFNWEENPSQLRVDGGPANGRHKDGAGHIPPDKFVTVKWIVTTTHQAIYVDDQLRYENAADYSGIDRPVSIFPAEGSTVTVKSIKIQSIADTAL